MVRRSKQKDGSMESYAVCSVGLSSGVLDHEVVSLERVKKLQKSWRYLQDFMYRGNEAD